MTKWITKAEYARRYEMHRSSVTKAVQNGRLPVRGDKVDGDVDIRQYRRREPANSPAPSAAASGASAHPGFGGGGGSFEDLAGELRRARIDKLQADIVIQRQKDLRTRQTWRREDLAEFAAAFAESFSPFRASVVKFRLSAEQLAEISRVWDACWETFITRLEDMELAEDESRPTAE